MNKHSARVAWRDGMRLGPEHFRGQAQYCTDSIAAIPVACEPNWGFVDCRIDHQAIHAGIVGILEISGTFPAGLSFNVCSESVARREAITEKLPVEVLVSITPCETDANGWKADRTDFGRHAHDFNELHAVCFAPPRVHLKWSGEKNIDPKYVLPLARIRSDRDGLPCYDPTFVPPCVRVTASRSLVSQIEFLLERMNRKVASGEGAWQRIAPTWLQQLWFLAPITRALSETQQLLKADAHPFRLFQSLSQLAGILGTAADLSPLALPLYNHLDIGPRFTAVIEVLLSMLDLIFPVEALPVAIDEIGPSLYVGTGEKRKGVPRWILALRTRHTAAEVIPYLVKVAAPDSIRSRATSALPGFPLRSMGPQEIPQGLERGEMVAYFEVMRPYSAIVDSLQSEWLSAVREGRLGLYAPERFFDKSLRLYNLFEQG